MNYSFADIEAFCARFYGGKKLLIQPYSYNMTFLALAQNTTQAQTLNIQANADFVLLALNHRAQIGAVQDSDSITAPFVRVLLTDSGSNQQFTNVAVDLENYSGNSRYGNPLAYPRVIAGRSTISTQVTNFAPAAETYTTLDICLQGVLVQVYAGQA